MATIDEPRLSEIEQYLNGIVLRTELNHDEVHEAEELVGLPGLRHLLGLLLGTRQGLFVALQNTPLNDETGRYTAAVTQGQIRGIDTLRATLIELFGQDDKPSGSGDKK